MSSSGKNTLGYGKTKAAVLERIKSGMSCKEIAKSCGLSYSSVYNCLTRMGVKFPTKDRQAYGYVKQVVLYEHENGLSPSDIISKYCFKNSSVYAVYRNYILKRNKPE